MIAAPYKNRATRAVNQSPSITFFFVKKSAQSFFQMIKPKNAVLAGQRGQSGGPKVHSNTLCCPARMARLASHAAAATCALLVVALAPRVVGDDTTSRFTFKVCISLPTHTFELLGWQGSVCERRSASRWALSPRAAYPCLPA